LQVEVVAVAEHDEVDVLVAVDVAGGDLARTAPAGDAERQHERRERRDAAELVGREEAHRAAVDHRDVGDRVAVRFDGDQLRRADRRDRDAEPLVRRLVQPEDAQPVERVRGEQLFAAVAVDVGELRAHHEPERLVERHRSQRAHGRLPGPALDDPHVGASHRHDVVVAVAVDVADGGAVGRRRAARIGHLPDHRRGEAPRAVVAVQLRLQERRLGRAPDLVVVDAVAVQIAVEVEVDELVDARPRVDGDHWGVEHGVRLLRAHERHRRNESEHGPVVHARLPAAKAASCDEGRRPRRTSGANYRPAPAR
jgi:hypothetical protein